MSRNAGQTFFVPINSSNLYGGEKIASIILSSLAESGFRSIVCLPNSGPLAEHFRKIGVEVVFFKTTYSYYNPFLPSSIAKLMESCRTTALYTHLDQAREYCFSKAAHEIGVPLIIHRHNPLHFSGYSMISQVKHKRYKVAVNKASKIIAVSSDVARSIRESGITAPVEVVHNGIDMLPLDLQCVPNIGARQELFPDWDKKQIIGFVGRITESKGIYDLLDAFAVVRDRCRDARLVYVGDDIETGIPNMMRLKTRISELNLGDYVRLLPYTPDIISVYSSLNVLALPSWNEGLPLVMIEAAYAGVPLITSNCNGMAEFMINGVTGLTVTPGDVRELAACLQQMVTDAAKAKAFARAAQDRATAIFSKETMCNNIIETIQSAIGDV